MLAIINAIGLFVLITFASRKSEENQRDDRHLIINLAIGIVKLLEDSRPGSHGYQETLKSLERMDAQSKKIADKIVFGFLAIIFTKDVFDDLDFNNPAAILELVKKDFDRFDRRREFFAACSGVKED
jgi:hypothetical protein